MAVEEVSELFIIDTSSFHDKHQGNVVGEDIFLEPSQEEFEACGRVFEGFGLRENSVLLGIDSTKAGIEGFVRDI